jgi:membrane-associated phospholipid phosphatase
MWILAVALTVAIGLSRVFRGEHYPTDVIAGLLLGVGSLVAGVFIIRVAGVNRSAKTDMGKKQISAEGAARLDQASP